MLEKKLINDYLIFTDLDGTLLDHHSYSFDEAREMLDFIEDKNIPLIIVTSKTKDEVILLQKQLNISYPFIIENGAGIFVPIDNNYESISLGMDYEQTLYFFKNYSKLVSMKGFHQMNDEEVSLLTGLSLEKASLAKKRNFSEPFILNDEHKLNELKNMANMDGLDVVKGGRFYHLITKGQDKANALLELKLYYEKLYEKSFKTIALGDGQNDITMLKSVDHPILIKNAKDEYISCEINNLTKASFQGPKGWNDSLKRFFKC